MNDGQSRLGARAAVLGLSVLAVFGGCDYGDAPTPPPLGPEWIVYQRESSPLVSDSVYAIAPIGGDVYVGTEHGVSIYRRSGWGAILDSVYFMRGRDTSRRVTAIHRDRQGAIWFGFGGGGVKCYNTHATERQWITPDSASLPHPYVHSIASDILGDVWIGTGRGVSRFIYAQSNEITEGRWKSYNAQNSPIPDEAIRAVGSNPYRNEIWFGTSTWGAISFDGELDWNLTSPADNALPVISMDFGAASTIWFGMFADYAYKYSPASGEWTQVGSPEAGGGLPGHFVTAIAVDGGDTWFGTNRGLARLSAGAWEVFDTTNSPLPSNAISALLRDPRGNLWIGTDAGLIKYRKGGTVN